MRSSPLNFDIHGCLLQVRSDVPLLLEGVRSRLLPFEISSPPPAPDLVVEVVVPPSGDHEVIPPPATARPVYDPPAGEVLYDDESDSLFIDYRGQVRLQSVVQLGRVTVSVFPPDPEQIWFVVHPFFTLTLIELLKRRGRYSLHASGAACGQRAVLFPGPSGSGKSTVAVALLRAGLDFLGDDTVFLASGHDGLRVLAFPDEIDFLEGTSQLFPELLDGGSGLQVGGRSKRSVRPEFAYPTARLASCARPEVLLFPRVAPGSRTRLEPMSREETLVELAPNVLLTEKRSSQTHLETLGELARSTSQYRLRLGRNLDELPMLVKRLLAEH